MRRKSLVWMVVVLLLNALAIFGVVMLGVRFEVTLAVVTFISSFPTFVIPAAGVCMPHPDAKGRGKAISPLLDRLSWHPRRFSKMELRRAESREERRARELPTPH